MTINTFDDLPLCESVQRALKDLNYVEPTPIQAQAIPPLLEGRDLLGCAQTGTGKTAAFALPIIEYLRSKPLEKREPKSVRVLVVAPTRELAMQIDESFKHYTKYIGMTRSCVYGGVGKDSQRKQLARGVDVLSATPGRLLDLRQEGSLRLDKAEIVVLDEADRMLDMGFIHDVKKIIALLPAVRRTILFSATMPPEIAEIAAKILHDPVRVDVAPESSTVEKITQKMVFVPRANKADFLLELMKRPEMKRILVFTKTKHVANRLSKRLSESGFRADAIHANKSQNARVRSLELFRDGKLKVLVATDIAARGLDIDDITHVVNFDMPTEPETYVHRIGRTARAGADGEAWSICSEDELDMAARIERLIEKRIEIETGLPFTSDMGYDGVYDKLHNRRSAPLPIKRGNHAERTVLTAERMHQARKPDSQRSPDQQGRGNRPPGGQSRGNPSTGSGARRDGNGGQRNSRSDALPRLARNPSIDEVTGRRFQGRGQGYSQGPKPERSGSGNQNPVRPNSGRTGSGRQDARPSPLSGSPSGYPNRGQRNSQSGTDRGYGRGQNPTRGNSGEISGNRQLPEKKDKPDGYGNDPKWENRS